MDPKKTYREKMGHQNPPAGTRLNIKYLAGIHYYLVWEDCPDNENIVEGWFKTKAKAENFAKKNGWIV